MAKFEVVLSFEWVLVEICILAIYWNEPKMGWNFGQDGTWGYVYGFIDKYKSFVCVLAGT